MYRGQVLGTHPALASARWRAIHGTEEGPADPALVPEGVTLGAGITTKHLRVREMGLNSVPGRCVGISVCEDVCVV